MYTTKAQNRLALLFAVIVLVGFSSALNTAFAAEAVETDSTLKIETSTTR